MHLARSLDTGEGSPYRDVGVSDIQMDAVIQDHELFPSMRLETLVELAFQSPRAEVFETSQQSTKETTPAPTFLPQADDVAHTRLPSHCCGGLRSQVAAAVRMAVANCCSSERSCDPFVRVTLKPENVSFKTLPIFGGGARCVHFTPMDHNTMAFKLDPAYDGEQRSLFIEVLDEDIGEDREIGRAAVGFRALLGAPNQSKFATVDVHNGVEKLHAGTLDLMMEVAEKEGERELAVQILSANDLQLNYVISVDDDGWFIFYAGMGFLAWLLLWTLFFSGFHAWSYGNALWYAVVTLFSVGYGDYSPTEPLSKVLNCIYIFGNIIIVGFYASLLFNYLVKQRDRNDRQSRREVVHTGETPPISRLQRIRKKLQFLCIFFVCIIVIVPVFYYLIEVDEATRFCPAEGPGACKFGSFIDTVHFTFVSISTVGYGDVYPVTTGGKIFGIFFLMTGVVGGASLCATVFDYVMERRRAKIAQDILERSLVSKQQLFNFDGSGDAKIDRYEFLTRILILQRAVDPHILRVIMERFDTLDTDGSGQITAEDFDLADKGKDMLMERLELRKQDLMKRRRPAGLEKLGESLRRLHQVRSPPQNTEVPVARSPPELKRVELLSSSADKYAKQE